jgi:hypothetical protein
VDGLDRDRVRPSSLACELSRGRGAARYCGKRARQTVHPHALQVQLRLRLQRLYPGDTPRPVGRETAISGGKLRGIAQWLADWARSCDERGENLIARGDFNIDRQNHPLCAAHLDRLGTDSLPEPHPPDVSTTLILHHLTEGIFMTRSLGSPAQICVSVLSLQYTKSGGFSFLDGLVPADTDSLLPTGSPTTSRFGPSSRFRPRQQLRREAREGATKTSLLVPHERPLLGASLEDLPAQPA